MYWSLEDHTFVMNTKLNHPTTRWEEIAQQIDERHNAMACRRRFIENIEPEFKIKMSLAQRRLVCKMRARTPPATYQEISEDMPEFTPEQCQTFFDYIATDKEIDRGGRDAIGERAAPRATMASSSYQLRPQDTATARATGAPPPYSKAAAASFSKKATIPTVTPTRSSSLATTATNFTRTNFQYWTADEEKILGDMYAENKPWTEIADAIGRSAAACRSKFGRLDHGVRSVLQKRRLAAVVPASTALQQEPPQKIPKIEEEEEEEELAQDKQQRQQHLAESSRKPSLTSTMGSMVSSSSGPVTRNQSARMNAAKAQQQKENQ